MSNANSLLEYESGVTPYAMSALTDSGDHKNYTSSAALFSESSGNAPDVRPDGVKNGLEVIPAVSATNNAVDVSAGLCSLAGVDTTVAADLDVTITRAATNVACINSITINSGGSVVAIKGTDSSDTSFSEVRGAAGGPPYIPVGSIELAQVRVTTNTAGVIVASEIKSTIGTHREKADFPVFTVDNFNGEVNFAQALPASHTGDVAKGVYASYADPIFTEQPYSNDYVPSETSYSVSSEQTYSGPVSSSSASINQGSFTAILNDGITDNIIGRKGENLFFRYYQDKTKAPHILDQGILGVGRTFGASDNPKVSCTISPKSSAVERAS